MQWILDPRSIDGAALWGTSVRSSRHSTSSVSRTRSTPARMLSSEMEEVRQMRTSDMSRGSAVQQAAPQTGSAAIFDIRLDLSDRDPQTQEHLGDGFVVDPVAHSLPPSRQLARRVSDK